MNKEQAKPEISQQALWGISATAVVVIVGFLIYLFRASDPAAHGPIPYRKFDYGAHMQQQMQDFKRQPTAAAGSSQLPQATQSPSESSQGAHTTTP